MASVINTNIASLNTQRNLNSSQSALNTSLQRLSSGLRINSSKDDAAGLAIATALDSQVRGQQVAIRNSNDAISFAQTAEGNLAKQTDALQRMRELAVQSANGTNSSTDRDNLNAEFTQLAAEITRLGQAEFNGQALFGTTSTTFQVGAGTTANVDTIEVAGVEAADATATAIAAGISGANSTLALAAITEIDNQLEAINTNRATLGAVQNRFESVVSNLQVSVENLSAAKSRIMDADFAAETANLTRSQILQQAGTAMLAQANSLPNNVLSLLRG
ncbi:MAG: flagellin FliC [Methylotenera sp.]|uniref:flagellin N-terminal helical domain-containing protein n=1 Tax=Methylotenera sp. TaxID=2051956 RepID=UPI000D3FC5B0|nr:flagellin [Methylotenera sp.]PPC81870.1 MAG: flagellin FliC [Methylotenera sp.]